MLDCPLVGNFTSADGLFVAQYVGCPKIYGRIGIRLTNRHFLIDAACVFMIH